MPKLADITGLRSGRLQVISRVPGNSSRCICRCDCGSEKEYEAGNIRMKRSKSCGCLQKETGPHNRSHNLTKSPTYKSWSHMLYRCNNPSSQSYMDYGGRGISVCDRWHKFENFLEDMGLRPTGTTIDRIDNDGNYEKSNCQWSNKKRQANNRRSSKLIEYQGEMRTMSELADIAGISIRSFWYRINSGWDIGRIMSTKTVIGRNQFTT